jgi:hypothetical protein
LRFAHFGAPRIDAADIIEVECGRPYESSARGAEIAKWGLWANHRENYRDKAPARGGSRACEHLYGILTVLSGSISFNLALRKKAKFG